MTTGEDEGDGMKRKDFPGGWPDDARNAFMPEGRTAQENDMFNYVQTLLRYRQSHDVLQTGKIRHFIPMDGIYAYFRYNSKKVVMVLINNNETVKAVETSRFDEFLKQHKSATEVITGATMSDLSAISIPGKSVLVVDLK